MHDPRAREPIHLNPHGEVAERVLLPGDPQRALAVASAHLESPRMLNARRGLWGYTGTAPDGGAVTVQSTGMGGPSAAIVVEELIGLGARTLIRIGTCGALSSELRLGDLVAARAALACDGASRALGAADRVDADAVLTAALVSAGGARAATIASTDLFYDPREDAERRLRELGAGAVEMEAATVLTLGRRAGLRAACLLTVTDVLGDGGRRERLDSDAIEAAGVQLGAAALRALAAAPPEAVRTQ